MFRWFGKKKDRVEFQIEGEFCEHCAAKMERELSKIVEIGQTKINYELKTISLPATMKDQAQAIMERIEMGSYWFGWMRRQVKFFAKYQKST